MSACAAQVFSGIDQRRFARLSAKAEAEGIFISGNVGSATQGKITIAWDYDPATETLTLQCTDAPFYLGCVFINSNIHSLVDGCP
jgi:hypothetical protein